MTDNEGYSSKISCNANVRRGQWKRRSTLSVCVTPLASGWPRAEVHTHLLDRSKTFFFILQYDATQNNGSATETWNMYDFRWDWCFSTWLYNIALHFFFSMIQEHQYTHRYLVCHNKSRSSFLFWHGLTFPCCCPKNSNNVCRLCDTALVCVCVCVCVSDP